MIVVRNLTKRFGEVRAVQDVSFEVNEGEVMGFLGPNGAGKTTTIRILTGFLPATAGIVQLDGLDVQRESLAVRERIGYLPEQVPLYLEMRVEEYLRFRARLKGVSRRETMSHIEEAMENCGLMHMRRRIIGQLSKGYRQRVGLADALVARPKILILDEATGGLDPHQRKEVLELIRGLARRHTVLISSHVLSEVEMISDRVMIIQQGRLVAQGRPRDLAEQLQESPRVIVEVQATPDKLRGVLGADASFETLADGWSRASMQPPEGQDPRAELAKKVAEAGLPLRELTLQVFSLEELFLRITAEAAQETGGVAPSGTAADPVEAEA